MNREWIIYVVLLLNLSPATSNCSRVWCLGLTRFFGCTMQRHDCFLFSFFFNVIIVVNSSDLKDPYSNMVAGQATPSGVFGNDIEGKDQDLTVKKHCKSVVAIPDRLDCLREIVEFCIPGYLGQAKNVAWK